MIFYKTLIHFARFKKQCVKVWKKDYGYKYGVEYFNKQDKEGNVSRCFYTNDFMDVVCDGLQEGYLKQKDIMVMIKCELKDRLYGGKK